MGRRIFLHIGTMKSATTYVQGLCELNRDHLALSGVMWPPTHTRYAATRELFGRANEQTDPAGSWADMRKMIREHPGDVVYSNELLSGLSVTDIKRLVRAFQQAELHVIITARDPARVVPSHWQTAMRNGARTESWAEFASSVCSDLEAVQAANGVARPLDDSHAAHLNHWFWRQQDVAALVARWRRSVPVEQITIVTVPPSGSDPELVARRFGAVIGVELGGLPQPEHVNTSLGAHSTELLRRVNLQMPDSDRAQRKYGIRGALARSGLTPRAELEPAFALTQEQHDWLGRRAHRMIDEIRQSGVNVEGELADLIPAEHPRPGAVDPADATDGELLDAALSGLAGMVRDVATLRMERNEARIQLKTVESELRAARSDYDELLNRPEPERARLERIATGLVGRQLRGKALLRRSRTLRGLVQRARGARAKITRS